MKHLVLTLLAGSLLGGCATPTVPPAAVDSAQVASNPVQLAGKRETLLLVSLADGSVIMQTIDSEADICFKQNSQTSTTCLTQGEPIVDPVTQAVIGYETIEAHIELVASSSH